MRNLLIVCWLLLSLTAQAGFNVFNNGTKVVYNPITHQYQLETNIVGPFHNPITTPVIYSRPNYAPVVGTTNWIYVGIVGLGPYTVPITTNYTSLGNCTIILTNATILDSNMSTNGLLGSVSISQGTNLIWTPASGNTTNTAIVVVTDCDGFTATNDVVLYSTNGTPPIAINDVYSTFAGNALTLQPVSNDLDPLGTGLTLTHVTVTNGMAAVVGNNLSLTTVNKFLGTNHIVYVITDGLGLTATGMVSVITTNWPPVGVATNVFMTENSTATFYPLPVDTLNMPGGELTITAASCGIAGTSVSFTTNSITFSPTPNYTNSIAVSYTISDNAGGTNSSGLVNVTATNIPPTAPTIAVTVADISTNLISVLTNCTGNVTGSFLSLVSVSGFPGASVAGTNVLLKLTNNYGFTTFNYTIYDGAGGTSTGTVNVNATNLPPVVVNQTFVMPFNSTNVFPILSGSYDPEGGALRVLHINLGGAYFTTTISNPFVIIVSATLPHTNTVQFSVYDPLAAVTLGQMTVCITNVPPIANPDNYAMTENTSSNLTPLVNDTTTLPFSDFTIDSVTPTNGNATISGSTVVFVPTTNFIGTATIGYTIDDGDGGTASSVMTVLVTNIPPSVNSYSVTVPENSTNVFGPISASVNTPGGHLSLVGIAATNASAVISSTNVIVTLTSNFVGTATIGYTVSDNIGGTNTGLITVITTNNPPVANLDYYSMPENTSATFSPTTNDVVKTSGGHLTITSASSASGTVTITVGTNLVFTPTLNFTNNAIISYTISDNIGGTASSYVNVLVTNVPPTAVADSFVMVSNTTAVFNPTTNDVLRTPNGTLVVTSVSPLNGTASYSGNNVSFTPTVNFLGTAYIGYGISDSLGGVATNLITVTVTNAAPAAGILLSNLFSNTGPDGGTLTATINNSTAYEAFTAAGTWYASPTNYIQYHFTASHVFTSVVFGNAGNSGPPSGNIVFQASNDGVNYVVLGSVSGQPSGGPNFATFSNPNSYTYFRVQVSVGLNGLLTIGYYDGTLYGY